MPQGHIIRAGSTIDAVRLSGCDRFGRESLAKADELVGDLIRMQDEIDAARLDRVPRHPRQNAPSPASART
jgi:hypothetical protein